MAGELLAEEYKGLFFGQVLFGGKRMPGGFLLLLLFLFFSCISASLVPVRFQTDGFQSPPLGEAKAAATLIIQFWFGNLT